MKKALFLLCNVIIVLTSCQSKATPTPYIGSGTAKIGDITMYFEGTGNGKPLILLGPGFSCSDYWSKQVEAFADQYNVIVPESRGMCRTTGMDTETDYHIMAEDTLKLMDYLGIDKTYIVGENQGAITTLDLAINHPDRLNALVSIGANTNPQGIQEYWRELLKSTSIEDITAFFAPPEYLNRTTDPENIQAFMEKMRTMWLNEPNFTAEQLASIKVPTLIIAGSADAVIRHEHHQEITDAISNAELIYLPNETEHVIDGAGEQFNQAVVDFFKDK